MTFATFNREITHHKTTKERIVNATRHAARTIGESTPVTLSLAFAVVCTIAGGAWYGGQMSSRLGSVESSGGRYEVRTDRLEQAMVQMGITDSRLSQIQEQTNRRLDLLEQEVRRRERQE